MKKEQQNIFPIPYKDYEEMKKLLEIYLVKVKWSPKISKKPAGLLPSEQDVLEIFSSNYSDNGEKTVSILSALDQFNKGINIMPESSNKILNTLLSGFGLGWALAKLYSKTSGLDHLRELNKTPNGLTDPQKGEMSSKAQTEAAAALFTAAHYIVSQLALYRSDDVSVRILPKIVVPEFNITRKDQMINCILFYYQGYLSSQEVVSDEVSMVKMTIEYFNAVLNELDLQKSSLQYLGSFENQAYEVEGLNFTFTGFDRSLEEKVSEIMVKEVRFDEIVGNREIKLETKRMVERLLTYNPKDGRNPMAALRGFVRTSMGMGIPGTGKTMLICAAATLLKERCKELGYPLQYLPLNLDIVSKFQGESAERMMAWFKPQKDHNKIIFAPIDDAESVFAKRDGGKNSEGSDSIVKVFLTQTEGADTIWLGNSVMPFYSNNWEIIDPAVLSRIQKRTFILGAETVHDFLDQNHLFMKDLMKTSPDLIKFVDPQGYKYLTDQGMLTSYSAGIKEEDITPKNEVFYDIFNRTSQKFDPLKNPDFIATVLFELKKVFPKSVGSRDVRNVHSAIYDKLMDFDYTTEMWENPDVFFNKKYDEKLGILTELRNANMKGISFERIFLQEFVKYIDVAIAITNTDFEKKVSAAMEYTQVNKEAARRLEKQDSNHLQVTNN